MESQLAEVMRQKLFQEVREAGREGGKEGENITRSIVLLSHPSQSFPSPSLLPSLPFSLAGFHFLRWYQ
jgi:hypothetical protein